MPYAHSTQIDKLLESVDQHLGRVQHAFIDLIALIFAADDTSFHDPARRIRFGVVLAPEPSERVRRIIDDDPAIWQPAVEEVVREALGRERTHG